jgi:cysteine desulfurase
VNHDLSDSLPNTLSVAFDQVEARSLAAEISHEVFISTGSACHSASVEISPVLKAMNIDYSTAAGTVRISTGRYTTEKEIDQAIDAITAAVNKLVR